MPCAVSPGADISLDENSFKSEYYNWTSDTIWTEMGMIRFRSGWTDYRMFASASQCFAVSTALQLGIQAITGSAGRASGSCESILARASARITRRSGPSYCCCSVVVRSAHSRPTLIMPSHAGRTTGAVDDRPQQTESHRIAGP